MASKETWAKARYFKADSTIDKWGDPDAINDDLVLALDDFRHYIGCPLFITSGVETSGHTEKSYHYREQGAVAADVIAPEYKKGPINLLFDAMRFCFTGIGYYPHWKYNGDSVGGLHLDMRPLKWQVDETLDYRGNRWIGVPQTAYIDGKLVEKQVYLPMNYENLKKYGGIYNGLY